MMHVLAVEKNCEVLKYLPRHAVSFFATGK